MDEADLILSYGHDDDVSVLLQHLPKLHQTMLMSATLSDDVQALKALVMHDPVVLKISADGGVVKVGTEKGMSKVVKTDIKTDNGVIHVIDAVILP